MTRREREEEKGREEKVKQMESLRRRKVENISLPTTAVSLPSLRLRRFPVTLFVTFCHTF